MLSKWQIWDFFSSYDRTTLRNFEGVLIINTFDSLCLKLLKDFLFKGAPERVIHHKTAAEVNSKWIESEFQTLSLFPNDDNFFIHHSQDIASDLLDTILNLDLSNRFIILNFENEGVTWKKVLKNDGYSILQIESPRHWEFNKLLDFTCAHLRLPLGHEAKSWILDSLENNFQTFYDACCLLKLNHPDAKEVSVKEVRELLTIERLDQFLFASLFARKKFKDFYEKLISFEDDFDKLKSLFFFMQSHLIKMADTSYLAQKPRLSQYDKGLQTTSKLWQQEELLREVERFNRWEISCKKKDFLLKHEIRQALFSQF